MLACIGILTERLHMWHYLMQGGPLIWPILFVSLWALALIVERFFFLRSSEKQFKRRAEFFFERFETEGRGATLRLLEAEKGLVPEILREAWDTDHGPEAAEKGVEEVLSRQLPKLDKHLGTIATLGTLEPMIGLLGTITGMIQSFGGLAHGSGGDLGTISGGLAIAMINTQAGLFTALPILLAHQYLRNRHRDLLGEVQGICAKALKMGHKHVHQ